MFRVAIINDTAPTHHYGCLLVMKNLTKLLTEQGIEIVWTWPVGIDWRKHKSKIKKMAKVDAVIVNGEGTIHHSAERKHARGLSEFAEFATNELNLDSYLINATLYQNTPELYENLKHYKRIFVRDSSSLKELASFGLQGTYVPDLTFAYKSAFPYQPTSPPCIIDTALKKEIPVLKQLCQDRGFGYRSMVVSRLSNVNFFKSPRPFVKNILKWLREDRHVSTDPQSFIKYLCDRELVITGRYHSVTMSIKQKVPFVAFESNTPKTSFLLEDVFGEVTRIVRLDEIQQIDLSRWVTYSPEEIVKIESFTTRAAQDIFSMIETISADIKRR